MFRVTLVSTLLVLLLTGCMSSPIVLEKQTETTIVDFPQLDEAVEKRLGETLVAKGERTVEPAIEIIEETQFNKKEGEASIWTCAVTIDRQTVYRRGTYPHKEGDKSECYGPVTHRITLADGKTNWNCPGQIGTSDICIKENGDIFLAFMSTSVPLKQDHSNIRKTTKAVVGQTNLVQELVYNGRVGNSLKLVYREFSDDFIRPAYTQEVQYDLTESNVIGFRNLRIEVLSIVDPLVKTLTSPI